MLAIHAAILGRAWQEWPHSKMGQVPINWQLPHFGRVLQVGWRSPSMRLM